MPSLGRRCLAEFIGTAILLMAIIGSGIAAETLIPATIGVQLLVNALATGLVLAAAIWAVVAVSGGHLNPAVTLVARAGGDLGSRDAACYVTAQITGAITGAILANLMFDLPAVSVAATERWGPPLWLGELIATFTLVLLIFALVRSGRAAVVPAAVGAFVAGAILFTSSTGFANPAVTIARTLSDTFAGIAPASVPAFLVAEAMGAAMAFVTLTILYPTKEATP